MQGSRPHLLRLGRRLSKGHQCHRNADSEDRQSLYSRACLGRRKTRMVVPEKENGT